MAFNQVSRNGGAEISSIDKGVKNQFKWNWLENKDANEMFLSDWVRKVDLAGKALCLICNKLMNYGNQGKAGLDNHANSAAHKKAVNSLKNNTTIPTTYHTEEPTCTMPYGAAPNIHSDAVCNQRTEVVLPKIPSFLDRLAHNEAFLLSFLCEHNLPFSMAPRLIECARFLAKDSKVLAKMKMDRTTASYKLTDGLEPVIRKKMLEAMRTSFFSFNVDECFSNNHKKIFSILVSYFSEDAGEVLVQHYKSQEFDKVNAKTLSRFVLDALKADAIPLDNVVSNLSDSTNYMRGKKAGFETLLREKIEHLLDIDGDICHHAHNVTALFLKPFGKVVEKLCTDLHTDMLYSTDMRGYLVDLCEILSLPYHMPPGYVEHRWLSILTAADVDAEMMDAFTLMYYGWVEKEDKEVYKDEVDVLMNNSSDQSRDKVRYIQKECSKKSLTEKGRERKKRIVVKLFDERKTTELHLSFYTHILPLIKSFVLVLELKEPLVHRVFDDLKECTKTFFCSFIKIEYVRELTAKELVHLDVTDTKIHKSFRNWNIGSKCRKMYKKLSPDEQSVFKAAVSTAFTTAAAYMQKKFPINNEALKLLSSLDQKCQGVEVASKAMKKLSKIFPVLIGNDQEKNLYDADVTKYHLLAESDMPAKLKEDGKTAKRLDHWWAAVFKAHEFPYLEKVVKAALSIVVGPRIEQSFTGMNSTITSSTNRLHTSTFSALQTVKMDLTASKQTSCQRYHRKNFLKSPINPWVCRGIQTASKARVHRYKSNLKRAAERRVELGLDGEPVAKKIKKPTYHERAKKVLKDAYKTKSKKVQKNKEK